MRLTDSQIADVKARADCVEIARDLGAQLRRSGRKWIGSCPVCGGGRRATRFEVQGDQWVCAVCSDGGDAIRLISRARGCDFRAAVEFLGGARHLSAEEAEKLARERRAREEKRERAQADYREKERKRLWQIWDFAKLGSLDLLDLYFDRRGLDPIRTASLRAVESLDYFDGEIEDDRGHMRPRLVHKGPAMLAAVIGLDGRFAGLHTTWLDLLKPDGKAEIRDPATGAILPAKKVRGTKTAGRIEIVRAAAAKRLFIGEGIETVRSVEVALTRTGERRPDDAFWSSVDLGNLGGAALETIPHPSLKHANGQRQRLPGPQPDLGEPAIPIPDTVEELFLLGDGDSEPVLTQTTLARAAARYARPGRVIRECFAPAGADFNDVICGRDTDGKGPP